MKYEITKNCLGIVENTVFEANDLAKAEAQMRLYSSGDEDGAWTLWEVDEAGKDRVLQFVTAGEPLCSGNELKSTADPMYNRI